MSEKLLNSYKLKMLDGQEMEGEFHTRCLRKFSPREGTELALEQKEWETMLRMNETEQGMKEDEEKESERENEDKETEDSREDRETTRRSPKE